MKQPQQFLQSPSGQILTSLFWGAAAAVVGSKVGTIGLWAINKASFCNPALSAVAGLVAAGAVLYSAYRIFKLAPKRWVAVGGLVGSLVLPSPTNPIVDRIRFSDATDGKSVGLVQTASVQRPALPSLQMKPHALTA